ncbi:serine hydrolase [Sphingopyxis sp. JAI108]|uniref:serine hydrolase domain-containing protein n=1 Tax=Sphingopyxis sp. JAI108 TaxID=2723060 RepID=UPI0015C9BBEE|nr:serine hydrolase domain-containing protein [Sphingopyxis sp. JAI108]NYF30854.1 CubicO group peptidase (beta-lactamase class C family) [Sphingopyxis sp. JAI108]
MRSKIAILLAIAVAAPFPAVAQDPAPETLDQLAPEIDALFAKYRTDQHIPGMVYGVVKDGKLAYVKGIGVQNITDERAVTPDSLFRIASMTKAFTALSILKLRDDGKLRLDDLAEQHIPEMKGWTYPTKDSPRIRIRDLLQHVGGFVTDDPWGDRQQVLPQAEFTKMVAAGMPFSRAPQSAHEYSNFGYALLGRVVANASGMAYADYVRQTILTPLGMTASGFDAPKAPKVHYALGYRWENDRWSPEPEMADGAFNSMGGLQVSANDYAKWVAFLLSAWPARDDADTGPVKRATVREIAQGLNFVSVTNRIGASGATACKQAAAYGMGWRVAQDCDLGLTLAHGGGYPGYGSHVMLMPDHGVGVFAMANRTYAGPSAPAWDTAVAMGKAGLLETRAVPVSPAVAEAYAAAKAAYAAGNLGPLEGKLAMNFLMDRSADNWTAELAELKEEVGECPADEPLAPIGAMSTAFRLDCAKGKLDGILLLAPTTPPTVQALRFRVVPPEAR